MAVAILAGLFALLVAGLAVAVSMAVQARRELEGRDEQFAEGGGSPLYRESVPAPWSPFDLDGLRDDDTDIDGHDPFATLIWADSPVSGHAASDSNGSERNPTTSRAPGADLELPADLTPVTSLKPLASPGTADAPVIVFVVGAGFLGTGTTAGVTAAARLRRAWVETDSFAQSGVITFDIDAEAAARPSDDPGATRDPVIVDDEPIWPRVRRRNGDQFSTPEADDSRAHSQRPNGSDQKPTADPEPIKWRPPAEAARRRDRRSRAGRPRSLQPLHQTDRLDTPDERFLSRRIHRQSQDRLPSERPRSRPNTHSGARDRPEVLPDVAGLPSCWHAR